MNLRHEAWRDYTRDWEDSAPDIVHLWNKTQVARKPYICDHCGEEITPMSDSKRDTALPSDRAVVNHEEWRPVQDFPDYEVSSLGNVRSVRRGGAFMALVSDSSGYATVKLCADGTCKRFKVNRLVCTAFHGPPDGDFDAAHIDGNRTHNTATNLAWKSRKDNIADKLRHGTAQRGERGAAAKLTSVQVEEIRQRGRSGEMPILIARDFPVGRSHVASILRGDRGLWSHD